MPQLIDGILVDDSSSINSSIELARQNVAPVSTVPDAKHDHGYCVEHGDLANCTHKASVGLRAEDDVLNPRHPDFARKFCKSVTSKHETRELIREVAKEKHGRVARNKPPPNAVEHSWFWENVVKWGPDMDSPERTPGDNCYQKSRKWVAVNLEKKAIAIFLIILLLLDLCCLTVEIVLQEIYRDVHGHQAHKIERVEHALRAVSITILCIFAVEIVLLLYAFNLYFFRKPLYVLDVIVVGMSLFAELYLRNVLAAGLLVLLRGWRLVRIFHGVYSIGSEAKADLVRKLHDTAHALLETHWELQSSMRETRALKKRLVKYKNAAQNGANVTVKEGEIGAKATLRIDTEPEDDESEHRDKYTEKLRKKEKKKQKKAHKQREKENATGHDAV